VRLIAPLANWEIYLFR
jgi:hypothetical protein